MEENLQDEYSRYIKILQQLLMQSNHDITDDKLFIQTTSKKSLNKCTLCHQPLIFPHFEKIPKLFSNKSYPASFPIYKDSLKEIDSNSKTLSKKRLMKTLTSKNMFNPMSKERSDYKLTALRSKETVTSPTPSAYYSITGVQELSDDDENDNINSQDNFFSYFSVITDPKKSKEINCTQQTQTKNAKKNVCCTYKPYLNQKKTSTSNLCFSKFSIPKSSKRFKEFNQAEKQILDQKADLIEADRVEYTENIQELPLLIGTNEIDQVFNNSTRQIENFSGGFCSCNFCSRVEDITETNLYNNPDLKYHNDCSSSKLGFFCRHSETNNKVLYFFVYYI